MGTDILADLGYLFLGSRLKRLAERLQADAGKIIRNCGLPLQPSQFPLMVAIDRYGPLTVTQAVDALGVSQPAVTRSLAGLVGLGLVATSKAHSDLRQKTLTLTADGVALLVEAKASMWPRVDAVVADLCKDLTGGFLDQISSLEGELGRSSLEERFSRTAPDTRDDLSIVAYAEDMAADFYRINAEWIESMFVMEDNDRRILENPREAIIDRGGVIYFVKSAELGIIGTCALIKIEEGCFELTKMAVVEAARGRKAGEYLLQDILARATEMNLGSLYLLTNSKCESAIHLYEKMGFKHDEAIMQRHGRRYARCNVAMSFALPDFQRPAVDGRKGVATATSYEGVTGS